MEDVGLELDSGSDEGFVMEGGQEDLPPELIPLPWCALGMEQKDFMSLVERIRASPHLLHSKDGDGGILHQILRSEEDGFTPKACREAVGWILAGTSPTQWLRDLKETGNSTICGHIYKGDEMVFRCFSCATDPTCCVCSRCFEGSDCAAKGHQYQIFRAGAGGCCDCGDAEAWDRAGFCKRHSGPATDDPLAAMSAEVRAVAEELLPVVLDFACRAFRHEAGAAGGQAGNWVTYLHNDAVHEFNEVERAVMSAAGCNTVEARELTMKAHDDGFCAIKQGTEAECKTAYDKLKDARLIVNITRKGWLPYELRAAELFTLFKDLCGCCNGLRRIMCNCLMREYPDPDSRVAPTQRFKYVDVVMRADETAWHGVQVALHDFHIQMIAEDAFKNTFGDILVQLYPSLMQEMKDSKTEGSVSLLHLSVQIFTVNTVVTRLARESQLLETLFTVLNAIFDDGRQPSTRQVSVNSDVVQKQSYMGLCRDIQYVLRIPGVAKLFSSRETAVEKWLELLARLQGMDPNTRQRVQHIEFEMRSWSYAFGLTIEFVPLHTHIVAGYIESLGDFESPDQKEQALGLLRPAVAALVRWFRQSQLLEGREGDIFCNVVDQEDGTVFGTISYDTSTLPVSFQIPCHRFVTSCWAECIRWSKGSLDLSVDLAAACGEAGGDGSVGEKTFALMLLEHPLRIFLVLAQSQAGMWVRNGLAIPGQQYAYCGPFLCETMYETDVTALQLACCTLGADTFVRVLKERFEICKWVGNGPLTGESTETPDQAIILFEEFVYVLILVLSERGPLDDGGEDAVMMRRLIHRLAVGPQTYSNLTRALPRSVTDCKHFEDVLKEVADYRRPDATQTGMFDLKAELLKDADPYSCYLSRKEREIVRETKLSKCGHVLASFPRWPSCLSGLESLLVSPVLWNIIKRILSVALSNATDSSLDKTRFVTDTLMHEALHVVSMVVGYANDNSQRWSTVASLLAEGGVDSVAGLLAKLSVSGAGKSCRFELSVHKEAMSALVMIMSDANKVLGTLLGPLRPVETPGGSGTGESEEKEERIKRQKEARERALAQMAEQQRAFAAMMSDAEDEDEDEESGGKSGLPHTVSATEDIELQEDTEDQQCVLCHEMADPAHPLGLICFAQTSSVVSFSAGMRHGDAVPSRPGQFRRDCALDEASEFGWESPGCQQGHGVAATFCGHAMHQDCLDRYISSLELRLRTVDIGHGASVTEGEFPCPLCRGLGNALVPLFPRESLFAGKEEEEAAKDNDKDLTSLSVRELKALAKDKSINIVGCAEKADLVNALVKGGVTCVAGKGQAGSSLSPAAQHMLDKMAKRMFEVHERMCRLRGAKSPLMPSAFSSNAACVCSAAVYSLTAAEVHARTVASAGAQSGGAGFVSESDLFNLTCLVRAARAVADSSTTTVVGDWRWKKLAEWAQLLVGTGEGNRQGLVGRDVWGLFAHWLLLLKPKSEGMKVEFAGVVRIIWVAKVVQVIASFLQDGGCPKGLIHTTTQGEGPFESLLRLVKAEMGTGEASGAAGQEQPMAGADKEKGMSSDGGAQKRKWSDILDMGDVEAAIALGCLPFLRRASLLRSTLLGVKLPVTFGGGEGSESANLLRFLQLPGRFGLGSVDGAVQTLVVGWCKQIKASQAELAPSPAFSQGLTAVPSLHALPDWYHDMLKIRLKEKCTKCLTLPNEPAVCLLCGTLVCAGSDCCRDHGETGECTTHAISCGAGCSVFLFIKKCLLVLVRVGGGCRHSTPYLDAYGEEDPGLSRGRPLQLNNERYARLLQLWSSHKLHAEIARSPQNRGASELLWDSI